VERRAEDGAGAAAAAWEALDALSRESEVPRHELESWKRLFLEQGTRGLRWAALEPIRQGVRHAFGAFGKEIARRLRLRCD
jgi:hypothetical protein